MTADIIVAIALCGGIFLLIWALRGVMLTPVRQGKNTRLTVFMRVMDGEPGLEETLRSLCWLVENGTLRADIVADCSEADEETKKFAAMAARDCPYIMIITENSDGRTGTCGACGYNKLGDL